MTIEFLSSDLSVCDVYRGFWLWRRRASIQLVDTGCVHESGMPILVWRYVSSGADVEWDLARDIERTQTRERMRKQLEDDRRRYELDWQRVRKPRHKVKRIGGVK